MVGYYYRYIPARLKDLLLSHIFATVSDHAWLLLQAYSNKTQRPVAVSHFAVLSDYGLLLQMYIRKTQRLVAVSHSGAV